MESFLFLGLSLSLRRFLEGITFQRKKGEDERGVVLFWRGKCQTGEAKSAKYQHVRNTNVRLVKKLLKYVDCFEQKLSLFRHRRIPPATQGEEEEEEERGGGET